MYYLKTKQQKYVDILKNSFDLFVEFFNQTFQVF